MTEELDVWRIKDDNELNGLRDRAELQKLLLESEVLKYSINRTNYSMPGKQTLLITDVSDFTATGVLDTLLYHESNTPGKPIRIRLLSPGGSVFAGFAIYDAVKSSASRGHEIEVTGYGYTASMAVTILQAGTVRRLRPNAYMMIHEVSSGMLGKYSEMKDEVDFVNRLTNRVWDALAERSTLSAAQIKRKCARKDWWLDAEEALKYGFIDEIATD